MTHDPTTRLVLGIESSCDETGVALVAGSGEGVPRLLAHALHSQIDMHQAYGGVVPELASRDHIRRVLPLAQQVLEAAGRSLAQVDVVAYTRGPGPGRGACWWGRAWPVRWARRWTSR
jgi:N6-L-threonylcarbamoyladenine synthase